MVNLSHISGKLEVGIKLVHDHEQLVSLTKIALPRKGFTMLKVHRWFYHASKNRSPEPNQVSQCRNPPSPTGLFSFQVHYPSALIGLQAVLHLWLVQLQVVEQQPLAEARGLEEHPVVATKGEAHTPSVQLSSANCTAQNLILTYGMHMTDTVSMLFGINFWTLNLQSAVPCAIVQTNNMI